MDCTNKRDPYAHCSGSLTKANIDNSSSSSPNMLETELNKSATIAEQQSFILQVHFERGHLLLV